MKINVAKCERKINGIENCVWMSSKCDSERKKKFDTIEPFSILDGYQSNVDAASVVDAISSS